MHIYIHTHILHLYTHRYVPPATAGLLSVLHKRVYVCMREKERKGETKDMNTY